MAAGDGTLIRCIGALVHDPSGRLLLVKRGHPPARGRWAVPGGRVEAGESDEAAVVREVAEETGVEVIVTAHVGSVRRDAPSGGVYDIHDYSARPIGGTLRAGDDAADARWCDAAAMAGLPLVDGLVAVLAGWGPAPR